MLGTGFLIAALQSRGAEAALNKSLQKRIDRVMEAVAKKVEPDNDPYAQIFIVRTFRFADLSPKIGQDEELLTRGQLKLVVDEGRLRVEKKVPALGGDSTLLAEVRNSNQGPLVVIVGAPRDQASEATRRLLTTLTFTGVSLVTLLGLGGWLLAGAALRPVKRMADKAAQISAANLGQRILAPEGAGKISQADRKRIPAELAHLGNTLDDMLDRLDGSFRRERAFVDDASHELRTPLAIVRGELELALLHPGDREETQATLESSLNQITRLGSMADDLLVLARAGFDRSPRPQLDAGAVAESLIVRLRPQLRAGVALTVTTSADTAGPPAAIRAADLERIITNLITNAGRAAKSSVHVLMAAEDEFTTITVSDDGPGFPVTMLPHAFERFVVGSTSRTASGTGLGLSIVRALSEANGGSVAAANDGPLGGALVTVRLPSNSTSTAS
jgi:two-component system, OmpR family, sensor kinase